MFTLDRFRKVLAAIGSFMAPKDCHALIAVIVNGMPNADCRLTTIACTEWCRSLATAITLRDRRIIFTRKFGHVEVATLSLPLLGRADDVNQIAMPYCCGA